MGLYSYIVLYFLISGQLGLRLTLEFLTKRHLENLKESNFKIS